MVLVESGVAVFGLWDDQALLGWDLERERQIWRAPFWSDSVVAVDERLIAIQQDRRRLICLDASLGTERWHFEVPQMSQYSQVVSAAILAGGDIVLVTVDGQYVRLDGASGGVCAAKSMQEVFGTIAITEEEVLSVRIDEIVAIQHATMTEAWRADTNAALRPLFPDGMRLIGGVYAASESLVWTTLHAAIMAARIEPAVGIRDMWVDALPNAMFSLGDVPQVIDNYVYVAPVYRTFREDDVGLYCYQVGET